MVQRILIRTCATRLRSAAWILSAVFFLLQPVVGASKKSQAGVPMPPDLLLEGGRKLSFERVLSSEREIRGKPGFWKKLVDVVAGEPDYKKMVRPYGIAVDSHGRVLYGTFRPSGLADPALTSEKRFPEVIDLRNHSLGYSWSVTAQLDRPFSDRYELRASYTHSRTRDVPAFL